MKRAIAVCIGTVGAGGPCRAPSRRSRVVEEVQGKVTGAEFMDYVTPKTVIKLAAGGSVVISYMKSCQREKISGLGTVIIGTDESFVQSRRRQAREDRLRFRAVARDDARQPARPPPPCCAASRRQEHGRRRSSRSSRSTALRRWWKPRARACWSSSGSTSRASSSRSSSMAARPRANSTILPAPTVRWRPAAPMRRHSVRRRSCSGSIPRPSPAPTPIVGRLIRLD